MPSLNKDHAEVICAKLKAVPEKKKGAAHKDYSVYYDGVYLGTFGVRHGSNRNLPHNHIPEDLDIPHPLALELGRCTKQLSDFVSYMRGQGKLKQEPGAKALPEKASVSRPWDEIDWVAKQATETAEAAREETPNEGEPPEPPSSGE